VKPTSLSGFGFGFGFCIGSAAANIFVVTGALRSRLLFTFATAGLLPFITP
jgi:arginine exporter protein ArgO